MDKMTEDNVIIEIHGMLEGIEEITDIRTFEDEGVMTDNKGLVIKYDDGTEVQVAVVQSKPCHWEGACPNARTDCNPCALKKEKD